MPDAHAKLSPSAAERWLECPASIRMEESLPSSLRENGSSYAMEGTAAHALGELKARLAFGEITTQQYTRRLAKWRDTYHITGEVEAEMDVHTEAYVDLIKQRVSLYPNSHPMFEQRLDTGVPNSWGTSDTVIVSPVHVEVIDFKYGQGVPVEAKGNPQLRLYALGALDTYGDMLGDTEVVRITVHQPRLDHVLTDEMTPEALREWRESVVPIAEVALGPDAPFGPSETACRWCPASGRCRAQLEKALAEDFGDPDTLEPEEIAVALGRVGEIKIWLAALEEAALQMAYGEGRPIPGHKVVMSGGQRKVTDPDGAIKHLVKSGYTFSQVASTKIKGIGDLEKLLGKERFTELLASYVEKSKGRPALVDESDGREAISPHSEAVKEFSDEQ